MDFPIPPSEPPEPDDPSPEGETPFDPRTPPIRGFFGESPIPDLSRIPREHWVAVMARAHPRTYSASRAGLDSEAAHAALRLTVSADDERVRLQREERASPTVFDVAMSPRGVPEIDVRAPVPDGWKQVNFRLSGADYAQLQRGARLLGLRPSAAARLLAVRGVQQVLREAERSAG
jgi:hypothetical protein